MELSMSDIDINFVGFFTYNPIVSIGKMPLIVSGGFK